VVLEPDKVSSALERVPEGRSVSLQGVQEAAVAGASLPTNLSYSSKPLRYL
jgi:hypothetical protein